MRSVAGLARIPAAWLMTTLVALTTILMLQGSRVFVGYLVFVVDQSQRVSLAVIALVVFSAPALVWFLQRRMPASTILITSTSVLVTSRLILQFWEHPTARLLLGAATIVTWGWVLVVVLRQRREMAGLGLLFGLSLDLLIRMANRAIDLPWMPGIAAHLATLVLATTLVLVVAGLHSKPLGPERFTGTALSVIAIGPAIALHHLLTGNLGFAHVAVGGDRVVAWLALLGGVALGLASVIVSGQGDIANRRSSARITIVVATLLGAAGLWLSWNGGDLGLVGVVLTPASLFILLAAALAGPREPATNSRTGNLVLAFTAGLILQAIILFAYYSFTGLGLMLPVAWLFVVAGALLSRRLPGIPLGRMHQRYRWQIPAAGLIALSIALLPELLTADPQPVDAPGQEVTVMVYNIQSGFGRDRTWNLERTAETILAEEPDIVVLNEVGRGWLVTSGNDQLPWLSRRLDMPYVWGAASDDGLWGNAILSRFPMGETGVQMFASTQNLKRSATAAQVELLTQNLWVFGTHLDNPRGAGEARMEQVTELLSFWNERQPAVLAGDFNSQPGDDVMSTILNAGFVDSGATLDDTIGTSADNRRIDYILTAGAVEILDIWVPDSDASDHKPVVARLRVGP